MTQMRLINTDKKSAQIWLISVISVLLTFLF